MPGFRRPGRAFDRGPMGGGPARLGPAAPAADVGLGNAMTQELMTPAAEAPSPLLDDDSDAIRRDVKSQVRETITGAPAPYGAWNKQFGWDSKFELVIDPSAKTCKIVTRIFTAASEEVRKGWEAAIEGKWGGKYSLAVTGKDGTVTDYAIGCDLQWVTDAKDAHYTVKENTPAANSEGRAGLGGTSSMTEWGSADTVDITHEYGHMLGAPEDYFTTNGVDHTAAGAKRGFRDQNGGIMNNPSDDPFTQHYELVRINAAKMLHVDPSSCTVH